MKKISTCIECNNKFYWIDDDFRPRMFEGVYNTGRGNDQMCLQCANKKGYLSHRVDPITKSEYI